ncbi:MAG: citrate/2-methylcitrate synthase [Spirochaetaceae bacterium]
MAKVDAHAFLREHAERVTQPRVISMEMFRKYGVKRGLRNDDGTGVLAGLTEIGDVHGYVVDENEKTPVEGRLRYRGVDVRDIVNGFTSEGRLGFAEVVYLLLFGDLPDATTLEQFLQVLSDRREPPEGFWQDIVMRSPSPDIMNKLGRVVLSAYSYDENPEDNGIANVLRQSIDLIARFPVMVAYAFQAKRHYFDNESLYIHAPQPGLSTAENLLQMIRPDQRFTRLEAEILDLALVLHAEHGGGNNSAFTVHVVSSSATDTYAAISAAVGSLKGSRHGGANIQVAGMMDDIKENVSDWSSDSHVGAYLERILKKEVGDRSGLVYGMGHAVYTLSDPRAVLLKAKARELAAQNNEYAEEFALYEKIEVLTPEIFARVRKNDKAICANVDFYSGLVYRMLGIPNELFTPIFAISRVAGWCAHRLEEIAIGKRIIRPAYKNVLDGRPYVPMNRR